MNALSSSWVSVALWEPGFSEVINNLVPDLQSNGIWLELIWFLNSSDVLKWAELHFLNAAPHGKWYSAECLFIFSQGPSPLLNVDLNVDSYIEGIDWESDQYLVVEIPCTSDWKPARVVILSDLDRQFADNPEAFNDNKLPITGWCMYVETR